MKRGNPENTKRNTGEREENKNLLPGLKNILSERSYNTIERLIKNTDNQNFDDAIYAFIKTLTTFYTIVQRTSNFSVTKFPSHTDINMLIDSQIAIINQDWLSNETYSETSILALGNLTMFFAQQTYK